MTEQTTGGNSLHQRLIKAGLTQASDSQDLAHFRNRTASTVERALPKPRDPFQSLRNAGVIPSEEGGDEFESLKKTRALAREYQRSHNLMPLCIDIYSRYPVQGAEVVCKDEALVDFYSELFFNQLDYDQHLIDMSREYWTVGEVTTLGSFNEVLGVWDNEEILNPNDLEVTQGPFDPQPHIKIGVPSYLRDIIEKKEPAYEYRRIAEQYPELIEACTKDEKLDVSQILISRLVNKNTPWDLYGTPHMMRGFTQLMLEESLNVAQDSVANRLYSPFLLATAGLQDAGDGKPWIPLPEDLEEINDQIQMALAGDFRLLTHHMGLNLTSVFGRESMPRFDQDYQRIERKLLQIWGIGESLISGSSNGAYASSALNRELVTQLMATHQNKLKRHFQRRAELVAEAQEHFDYEISGGVRTPIYEEVYEIDEETGREYVRKRPKLLVPEIRFKTLNLRDEAAERTFLRELKNAGVPISDHSLAVNIPIEFDDEQEKVLYEKTQKIVAEQELKKRVREVLEAKGLPVPEEYQAPVQVGPPPGQDAATEETEQEEPPAEGTQSEPAEDITSIPDTPNIAPVTEDAPSPTPSEEMTRNQITQRPEISDEMRAARLGPALRAFDPTYKSVQGMRDKLEPKSVEAAVQDRAWENRRPGLRPRAEYKKR